MTLRSMANNLPANSPVRRPISVPLPTPDGPATATIFIGRVLPSGSGSRIDGAAAAPSCITPQSAMVTAVSGTPCRLRTGALSM